MNAAAPTAPDLAGAAAPVVDAPPPVEAPAVDDVPDAGGEVAVDGDASSVAAAFANAGGEAEGKKKSPLKKPAAPKPPLVKLDGANLPDHYWKAALEQAGLPEDTERFEIEPLLPLIAAFKTSNSGKNPAAADFVVMLPLRVQGIITAAADATGMAVKYHALCVGPKLETQQLTTAAAKKALCSRFRSQPFFNAQAAADPNKPRAPEKGFWLGKSQELEVLEGKQIALLDAFLVKIKGLAKEESVVKAETMEKEIAKEEEIVAAFKTKAAARVERNRAQVEALAAKKAAELARQGKARKSKVSAARGKQIAEVEAATEALAAEPEIDFQGVMQCNMARAVDLSKKRGISFSEAYLFVQKDKEGTLRMLAEMQSGGAPSAASTPGAGSSSDALAAEEAAGEEAGEADGEEADGEEEEEAEVMDAEEDEE